MIAGLEKVGFKVLVERVYFSILQKKKKIHVFEDQNRSAE